MLALIAGVMLLIFAACNTDEDITAIPAAANPANPANPATPTVPTPIELQFDHPPRYQVVPAWVEQGENTIAVNAVTEEGGEESGSVRYLPVIYAERTLMNNVYVIYLGQIDNVPIGDLDLNATYNGITPVTVTYQKSTVKTDKITESITTAVKQTTVSSRGMVTSGKFSTGFFYNSIGGTMQWGGDDITTYSSLIEEISVEETLETVKEYVDGKERFVSYNVGNHGEPAGRYRIALFATTDVYVTVQMKPDNSALVSEPEITVCARKSINAELDYDTNLYGDFPRTGGGGMLTVPDTDAFTALTPPPGVAFFRAVGKGPSQPGATNALYSTDGINWWGKDIGSTGGEWNKVTYGNGSWVAVAGSGSTIAVKNVARSNDGYNWTTDLIGSGNLTNVTNLNSVTYVNNSFVIAGSNYSYNSTSKLWVKGADLGRSSTNGSTWNSSNYGVLGSTADFAFYDDRWVEVNGTGTISSSTDFIKWTGVQAGADPWISVTAGTTRGGDKQFVAVGKAGSIAYWQFNKVNFDKTTWIKYTVGDSDYNRVHYNGEKYVAVGSPGGYGNMAWSPDGDKNWHPITVGTSRGLDATTTWEDVTYGNGLWVAVGNDPVDDGSKIATSTDGINWTITRSDYGRRLNGIAFAILPKAPF